MPTETQEKSAPENKSPEITFSGRYSNECYSAFNFCTKVLSLKDNEAELIANSLACDLGRLEKAEDRKIELGKVNKGKDGSKINIKEVSKLSKVRLTYALSIFKAMALCQDCGDIGVNVMGGSISENFQDYLDQKMAEKAKEKESGK